MKLSIEVLPKQTDNFVACCNEYANKLVGMSLTVMIPHINGCDYAEVIDACEALISQGFTITPHLAVRNLKKTDSKPEIDAFMQKVGSVLMIGGDNPQPELYQGVEDFIARNWQLSSPVSKVYFSSFPEGHPHVDTPTSYNATLSKCQWAQNLDLEYYLINQICFDASLIIAHAENMRKLVPSANQITSFVAPCKFSKLLKVAAISGLGNSMSFMKKVNVFKLVGYTSDEMMNDIAQANLRLHGLHVYPFGNYNDALQKLFDYQGKICS